MLKKIFKKRQGRKNFLDARTSKPLIIINCLLALIYFLVICFFFPQGNKIMFWVLIAGEVFHMWQLFTFLHTIWEIKETPMKDPTYMPEVDIFITVAGEPKDIVQKTLEGILAMEYPKYHVYILNDGYVAKRDNWQEAEDLAKEFGVKCITRKIPGGAKAGNINNALKQSQSSFVVIFDADHIPYKHFLEKMIPYFSDEKVAFVQSPQYYKNHDLNYVTSGSWEQQELFFGPICMGKNRLNAATMCGTNMAIRRTAIEEVGGMCEESIAEDFATGLFMHDKGWKSVYVSEILSEGLAPEDFLSYYKQQFRWARGALDIIFKYGLIWRKGLTLGQKIQYLSSASFYLSGSVVLMNAMIPVIFFFTGQVPFLISTMLLALIFLPYIFTTVYVLQLSSNFSYTFRSLAFSLSSFNIHIKALWSVVTGVKSGFDITSKKKIEGNFLRLVRPHIVYILLVVIGIIVAITREGLSPSVAVNGSWAILNVAVFSEFILAALPEKKKVLVINSIIQKKYE